MEQSYLKPMNLGEILDSSIKLYRKNFLLLVIVHLPATVFYLLDELFSRFSAGAADVSFLETASPESAIQQLDTLLIILLMTLVIGVLGVFVVYPLAFSAVVKVASDSVLGTPTSAKSAYKFCFRNWWRYGLTYFVFNFVQGIAIGIVAGIFIAAPLAVFSFAAVTSGGITGGLVAGLLIAVVFMGIGAVLASLIWSRWVLTFPAVVNEGHFYYKPMERSWNLVKGCTLRVFLPMFIVSLIPYVIIFTPMFMGLLMGGLAGTLEELLGAPNVVFGTVAQGLLIPLVHVTRVVVYFELRARKEGFDLEKRVEQLAE